MIINKALDFRVPLKKIKVDIIILSGNSRLLPESLSRLFDIGMIVSDSSVPFWKSAKWEMDCRQLNIPFYVVERSGALKLAM
jgi:hypothetical protein